MKFEALGKICKIKRAHQRCLEVSETDVSALMKKVIIEGLQTDESILFFADVGKIFIQYLLDGAHQKVCDAVIMTTYNGKVYLVFVELKSTSFNNNDIVNKFVSSSCLLDYCRCILKQFHDASVLDGLERRFVVFCLARESRLPKTLTRPPVATPRKPNHTPQEYREIECTQSGERVAIKKLL
ncbi:MAG: hypothetical protein HQL99_16695 [Magnetococcales bacterium]|nr:hypothetical protein [Magnetococcales bacterium]